MSSIESWFFKDLSLKYLATVRTVRVLWRQWRRGCGVKRFIDNILQESDISELSPSTLVHLVTIKFNTFVDELILPATVKNELSLFFRLMLQSVFVEWENRQWMTKHQINPTMAETISGSIDCITWNNVGCFDRKKLVELFASNKETISYITWFSLCYFCSEDYIRKFSDTVDWKGIKYWTDITIFWYYTIYGTFPTEDMFGSSQDFNGFQCRRQAGMYDEKNFNRTVLIESIIGGSLWTVKFILNKLTDAVKLELLSEAAIFNVARGDVAVYLLSQIKFDSSSTELEHCGPWRHLLGWPWVLFIDSWIDKCENMNGDQFVSLFDALKKQRREEQIAGIEGFTGRQIGDYLNAKYYVPCEKLWKLCCQKFGLWHESVFKIICIILNSEDFILCKIVLQGSTSEWRQFSLVNILCRRVSSLCISDRKFCDKFMKEILENFEERQLFQKVAYGVFGQRETDLAQIL